MKHLYDVVQKDHHLKHGGRLQLGLFFKGLGLPIDESIKFWRNNFTKRPEIDSSRVSCIINFITSLWSRS